MSYIAERSVQLMLCPTAADVSCRISRLVCDANKGILVAIEAAAQTSSAVVSEDLRMVQLSRTRDLRMKEYQFSRNVMES